MSVRRSLLAILTLGPCYASQLGAEFDRRTGALWPVNAGQVSKTLDRLHREGLVTGAGVDDQGRALWRITEPGRAEIAAWWAADTAGGATGRDALPMKIAIAASLPDVDVTAVVAAELAGARRREAAPETAGTPAAAASFAHALTRDARAAMTRAERDWLERTASRLEDPDALAHRQGLSAARPRRGRPARAASTGADLNPSPGRRVD